MACFGEHVLLLGKLLVGGESPPHLFPWIAKGFYVSRAYPEVLHGSEKSRAVEALASGGIRGIFTRRRIRSNLHRERYCRFSLPPIPMTISSIRCQECGELNEEWSGEAVCDGCGSTLID